MYSFFMRGVSGTLKATHPFLGGGGTVTGHSGEKCANVDMQL